MSSVVDTFRTFVAIELPPELREKLIAHITQLRRQLPDSRASWSRAHNLHLTLKFVGDVPVSDIPKLSEAIALAVRDVKPFELMVAACGIFPEKGRPNVLWIGIEDRSGELAILHQRIEQECFVAGFPRERRSFHPHLTIARLRRHGDERRLAAAHQNLGFVPQVFAASEVVVFKSELLREGSKHTPVSRHTLQDE